MFFKRIAAGLLSVVLSMTLCVPAFAAPGDTPSYACGLEEHVHSDACRTDDILAALLSANGLSGYDEIIYVVHQHGEACYEDGWLVCQLADSDYLSRYPNVRILHSHDGSCSGCTIAEPGYGADFTFGQGDPGFDGEYDPDYYVDGMPGGVRDQMDGGGDPGGIPVVVAGGTADGRLPICGKPEHTHGQACLVILTPASIAEALRLAGGTADVLIRQSVSGWTGDPSMAVYRVDVMDPDTGALVYSNVVGMPVSADGMSEYRLEDVVPAGSDVTVTSDWQGAGGALADCPGFYTCAGVPAGGTAIAEFGIGPDEDALANGTHGTGIVNPFHLDELSLGGPELPKTGGRGVSALLAYGTAAVLAWAVMTWYRRKGGRDDA